MKYYFDYNPIDCEKDERRKYNVGDIFKNQAKCLICNDVIISKNRHDCARCKCGNLSVDGGSWYLKRSFNDPNSYEELSINYKKI